MEENLQNSQPEPTINPEVARGLQSIAKWTRFISIFGFAMGAFVVMSLLIGGAEIMKTVTEALPIKMEGLYGAVIFVFFIFFFVFAAFLYFLFKAAQLLDQGVAMQDKLLIAEGFVYLKRFFVVLTVFGAISLFANISKLFE
ncbi:MAG: hypothetical protein IPH58_02420 [Sphingobacteriales bacterium]|jgi:hypothetical protein|nr:hypothetical protein [Sphingobacteriales bacterium]